MPVIKLRNPVAASPVLRKGGVHRKSKSGERAQQKEETKRALVDWKREKHRDD